MDIPYTLIYRPIKNPRLEFKHSRLFVIVPQTSKFDVEGFVQRHARWIAKHAEYYQSLQNEVKGLESVIRLSEDFTALVERYVKEGAALTGIAPKRIKYKNLKSRWGSCSSKGEVTINLKLRYFPDHLIWYVVFHELVHLRVLSHDQKFYQILKTVFPEYDKYDRQLQGYEYMLTQKQLGKLR